MKRYMQDSYRLLSLIIFLTGWEGVARIVDNSLLFPKVTEIFLAIKNIIFDVNFMVIMWTSLKSLILSILLSVVISVVFSTLAFRYVAIEIFLRPFIIFLRIVPTVVIIILILIWSSVDFVPSIAGILILFPILYDGILGGLRGVDKRLIKMSKVFDVPTKRKIKGIYIPSVYNFLSSSITAYVGLTFKVIIAGEVLAQKNLTIGGEIFLNKVYLESANIFSWIIIIIVLNFILEILIKRADRYLGRWKI